MTGKISEKELSPKLNDRLTQQGERLESIESEFLERYEALSINHGLNFVTLEKGAGLPSLGIKGRTVINHSPPFNNREWTLYTGAEVKSPEKLVVTSDSNGLDSSIRLKLKKNTDYSFSLKHNGEIRILEADFDHVFTEYTNAQSVCFNTLDYEEILFILRARGEGTYTFENVMLNEGNSSKEFVSGYQPIRDPMIEATGKNLLPPFTDWVNGRGTGMFVFKNIIITEPYEIVCESQPDRAGMLTFRAKLKPNTTYTLSSKVASLWFVYEGEDFSKTLATNDGSPSNLSFTTTDKEEYTIGIYKNASTSSPITFSNPQLELGPQATAFEPQKKSRTYYPDLTLASNEDGTVYDELLPSGEVVRRYVNVDLRGDSWDSLKVFDHPNSNSKAIRFNKFSEVNGAIPNGASSPNPTAILSKYNGDILKWGSSAISDQFNLGWDGDNSSHHLYINIPNTDSGWGDNYTPTIDEVRAYFNGWKMFIKGQSRTSIYNGTGEKQWTKLTLAFTSLPMTGDLRNAVPKEYAGVDNQGNVYTPYKLQYQLAEPRTEKGNPVGKIRLHKENNQIEVVEGFIAREKANPLRSGSANYHINSILLDPIGRLKHKCLKILGIYKNTELDKHWNILDSNAYGNQQARLSPELYDDTATYYVDYIALPSEFTAEIKESSLHIPNTMASRVENLESILSDESIGQDRGLVQKVDDLQGNMTNLQGEMQELFTSVDNGKNDLRTAIIGKGGSVIDEEGAQVNSFSQLVTGVNSIPQSAITSTSIATISIPAGLDSISLTATGADKHLILCSWYPSTSLTSLGYILVGVEKRSNGFTFRRGRSHSTGHVPIAYQQIRFRNVLNSVHGVYEYTSTGTSLVNIVIPLNTNFPRSRSIIDVTMTVDTVSYSVDYRDFFRYYLTLNNEIHIALVPRATGLTYKFYYQAINF